MSTWIRAKLSALHYVYQSEITCADGLHIYRVLPKSARWLMANDRKEEAWEMIWKAAQMNGRPLPKDLEMCQVEMQHFSYF